MMSWASTCVRKCYLVHLVTIRRFLCLASNLGTALTVYLVFFFYYKDPINPSNSMYSRIERHIFSPEEQDKQTVPTQVSSDSLMSLSATTLSPYSDIPKLPVHMMFHNRLFLCKDSHLNGDAGALYENLEQWVPRDVGHSGRGLENRVWHGLIGARGKKLLRSVMNRMENKINGNTRQNGTGISLSVSSGTKDQNRTALKTETKKNPSPPMLRKAIQNAKKHSKSTSNEDAQESHDFKGINSISFQTSKLGDSNAGDGIPYIIGITPTYYRMTQKLDLTSLCQTLMNVPRFLWIVIEDAHNSSQRVKDILSHCMVESVLLSVRTSNESKKLKLKGIDQRNMALNWIRSQCKECEGFGTCDGVVYFMDDDNVYDIRLFNRIRWTKSVSVFPVGFVGGLKFEGPICKEGKVKTWRVQYAPKRHIPVDMAGFAIHVSMIVRKPKVRFGFKSDQVHHSKAGYLEPDFLKSLGTNRKTVECRGMENEILVWHVKTAYRKLVHEAKHPSDPHFRV